MEVSEQEEKQIIGEENVVHINLSGKDVPEITEISFDVNMEIPLLSVVDTTTESISIIKSTINMLYDQLEFYKEEIREKNLLIKTLNFRNANDGDKINMNLVCENCHSIVETSPTVHNDELSRNVINDSISNPKGDTKRRDNNISNLHSSCTQLKIVDYDTTTESNKTYVIIDEVESSNQESTQNIHSSTEGLSSDNSNLDNSINSEIINQESAKNIRSSTEGLNSNNSSMDSSINSTSEHFYLLNSTPVPHSINIGEVSLNNTNDTEATAGKYEWEKFSTGFASKMLGKMGYKGGGLGKAENGITKTIEIKKKRNFGEASAHKPASQSTKDIVCIISDSMLNQIDAKRLSRKHDVRLMYHGGCTIRHTYIHLPEMFKLNPKHVILHIGTNDCPNKTSDEVLNELTLLKEYIEAVLPSCQVIISMPTTRQDNTVAAKIIQNLSVKLKRTQFRLLDNSNINISHLGKLGLHLNDHGTRIMAGNLISLIKRL